MAQKPSAPDQTTNDAGAAVEPAQAEIAANPAKPRQAKADQAKAGQTRAATNGPQIKKKDFIDRAVEKSGVRKADARAAIEAALATLASALAAGEELNLPPLGKLKVTRSKETGNGTLLMIRLKQSHDNERRGGKESLAAGEEVD